MKITFTICFSILIALLANAQKGQSFIYKNNIQLELGGHGLLYSVNLERLLINEDNWKMMAKVGASYYTPRSGIIGLWLPVSVNGLRSFGQHHMEFGIGQVITKDGFSKQENNSLENDWDMLGAMTLGYRFQRPEGRFLFRLAFTPYVFLNFGEKNKVDDNIFGDSPHWETWMIPSGGVSFGYAF